MSTRNSIHYLEKVRERIKNAKLQDEMIKYIMGEREMSQGQLKACIELMNRVVPVISQQQIEYNDITRKPREMALVELQEAWEQQSHQLN